jgi:hypothetical protein
MSTEPRRVRLLTALLLVAIFAAGVGTGAVVCRFAAPNPSFGLPPPPPGGPMPPPWRALGLRAEQEAKAHEILERHRPELEAIVRESFPRVRALHDRMDDELRAILDDAQRARLDELMRHRPPGPPPFPPPPH